LTDHLTGSIDSGNSVGTALQLGADTDGISGDLNVADDFNVFSKSGRIDQYLQKYGNE